MSGKKIGARDARHLKKKEKKLFSLTIISCKSVRDTRERSCLSRLTSSREGAKGRKKNGKKIRSRKKRGKAAPQVDSLHESSTEGTKKIEPAKKRGRMDAFLKGREDDSKGSQEEDRSNNSRLISKRGGSKEGAGTDRGGRKARGKKRKEGRGERRKEEKKNCPKKKVSWALVYRGMKLYRRRESQLREEEGSALYY